MPEHRGRRAWNEALNLSATQIHQIGLTEVARIRAQMDAIIKQVKFQGGYQEFLRFLRTDPRFYARTPEELLMRAAWIAKTMAYKLGELKIRELRSLAEQSLGARFDLREFHDRILANGSVPLDVLAQSIQRYIAGKVLTSQQRCALSTTAIQQTAAEIPTAPSVHGADSPPPARSRCQGCPSGSR